VPCARLKSGLGHKHIVERIVKQDLQGHHHHLPAQPRETRYIFRGYQSSLPVEFRTDTPYKHITKRINKNPVGLAASMFHSKCPEPVSVRTNTIITQTHCENMS
jgi:hypothetical protein